MLFAVPAMGVHLVRRILAAMILMMACASAGPPGPVWYRNMQGPPEPIPCDSLPSGAVKTLPASFSRFMRFACNNQLGEGLSAADGLHWQDAQGHGIQISSSNPGIPPDASGIKALPFSWYVRFSAADHTAAERKALLAVFQRRFRPEFPPDADVLEADARTSNHQDKRIFLIFRRSERSLPKWLIGLECNGACFSEDRQPLVFFGVPNP